MIESTIDIKVSLDKSRMPEKIEWRATDSSIAEFQEARAMMVNFWDAQEKAALRIDLWTQKMMIDEMIDFYYQTMMGMADSLQRSTGQEKLVNDLRGFAKSFFQEFSESQRAEQKNSRQ